MREKYAVHLALATGCLVLLLTILFAIFQSPETLSTPITKGSAIPHPLAGHRPCDQCHGPAGILPYPVRHLGWDDFACIRCHVPLPMPADSNQTAPMPGAHR